MIQANKALKMDAGQRQVRVIETIKGQLKSQEAINAFKILSPVVLQNNCNVPISMESMKYHAHHPRSLENTSLTPGLIQHDLQVLTQLANCPHGQVLILDGSNYQNKVADVFDKYTVIKGYNYRLEGADTKSVLLSYDHVLKQIEYEFKLGNGKYKPGFIGQIVASEALSSNPYSQAFKAYLAFSSKTNCPVLINCLELGQLPTYVNNGDSSKILQNKWRQLEEVIRAVEVYKGARVVLFNLPLELVYRYKPQQNCGQEVICLSHERITNLLKQTQMILAFDLNKYAIVPQSLNYLAMLCSQNPSRIILSGGITYKTELTTFGGDGFRSFAANSNHSFVLEHFRRIVRDESVLKRVMFDNKWTLIDWKIKLEEIEVLATWNCDKCGATNTVKVEAFKKFGKQFCSIKCLKAFNF